MNPGLEYYRPFGQRAWGLIVVAAMPSAGDTVTVDGTTYTFKENFGGADLNSIAESLARSINADRVNMSSYVLRESALSSPIKTVYTIYYANQINVVATSPGAAGNSLALSTSNSAAFVLPYATLLGGTDATSGSSTVTVVAGATTPQAHTVFSVDAVNAFRLSATSRPFKTAVLNACKAVAPYTANVDTVYLGLSNDDSHQFWPIYAGTFFTIEAPAGQTYNLNQFYGRAASALDGFSIIYS